MLRNLEMIPLVDSVIFIWLISLYLISKIFGLMEPGYMVFHYRASKKRGEKHNCVINFQ